MGDYEVFSGLLDYNGDTGVICWKVRPRSATPIGSEAGFIDNKGYRRITIGGKHYQAHRLAWLFTYRKWPDQEIDHINGIRTDNRICNLRDVSGRMNCSNARKHREGRIAGIKYYDRQKKWVAYIQISKKYHYLGSFDGENEAKMAYENARISSESNPLWTPKKCIYTKAKGYMYREDLQKYWVRISMHNKGVTIGYYDTPEEAHEAYLKAKAEKYGIPVKEAE